MVRWEAGQRSEAMDSRSRSRKGVVRRGCDTPRTEQGGGMLNIGVGLRSFDQIRNKVLPWYRAMEQLVMADWCFGVPECF